MLETKLRQLFVFIINLPLISNSSQLPTQFHKLRNSSGTNRMAPADKTSRWIYHNLPTIIVQVGVNEFCSFPFFAQTQGFVCYQLVRAEAVVELHDLNFLRIDPGLLIHFFRCIFNHRIANQLDVITKNSFNICRQGRSNYLYSLIFQFVLFYKILTADDDACRPIRGRGALEKCEYSMHFRTLFYFVLTQWFLILRIWVLGTVSMVFCSDLNEMIDCGAVLVHVLDSSISKQPRSHWLRVLFSHEFE